jgi:hypothetical protein
LGKGTLGFLALSQKPASRGDKVRASDERIKGFFQALEPGQGDTGSKHTAPECMPQFAKKESECR